MNEKINENCKSLETEISSRCDLLIEAIHNRKQQLLEFIHKEKEYKLRALKEQVSACTNRLQQTTGLLQFCIEALKETEAIAFLQIGTSLINRVNNRELSWTKELTATPWISPELELSLDSRPVLASIEQLTFSQMKPPESPILIVDECVAENNSITIAWKPQVSNFVEGFILELDDGNDGPFRVSYCSLLQKFIKI
ncbi:E3 ubiquitin-protein ligase TRIM9-like protein [Dinothrombium tinctorium]|uniref:E3 ubiquitin-protein ligase TRIM9-like protein n=1 Tax=Dinothrombium tinctorium TaxID=1965070 RepID=A0A443RQL8_9ACAR|nr:E3 ubiquitin-protein ligase TRIM9-like protein [Dinothrombium tinctorium]